MKLFLLTAAFVAAAIVLLSIKLLFGKRFPATHVGQNPAMRRKGIGCVQAQDAELRTPSHHRVSERSAEK